MDFACNYAFTTFYLLKLFTLGSGIIEEFGNADIVCDIKFKVLYAMYND